MFNKAYKTRYKKIIYIMNTTINYFNYSLLTIIRVIYFIIKYIKR